MNIAHIEWMIQTASLVCEKENIDDSLLLPLVILHDVGYSALPEGNYFKREFREAHMKAGEKIAKKILSKVNYPEDQSEKIAYYVSVHDNWALGEYDVYEKDVILGVFNDLDYTWGATPEGFLQTMKILHKNHEEMLEHLKHNEKLEKRPFCTDTTRKLYEAYLNDRKREK